ncbi:tyrosine-type recombinase/integrase [Crocosphaera sp. UHCC 0190]|uniref:tyrosine-type recombinase/integrase n=1 Tax=Crocosphaera sp. UHCC 0190 TaxID=3110246 RepID=UPI002B207EE7|nr:tyrosine-type recombinase/integrase [Crocosphaera sp. UHCC 0190]MEA5511803.1 tyrosine-type recombinase/integrase [Crocosphaera sp. UHCC 0190]
MTPLTTYHPPITEVDNDAQVIYLWLSGLSPSTQKTYTRTVNQFLSFVEKPLAKVLLEDLTRWVDLLFLKDYSQNSIALKVSTIKSLFSYAWKIGYLSLNIAKAVKAPSGISALHERILEQPDVKALIEAAKVGRGATALAERDRTLLTLIYATGLRATEVLSINWRDLRPRKEGGQVTVTGKGGKVRTVLISQNLYQQLQQLKRSNKTDAVFTTCRGNRLDRHQLHRIVKAAAEKAGINEHTSTHWLRHAHACHSLENGCDIDVLMRSLGHSSLTVTSKYLHARPNEGSSQFIDI